MRSIRRFASLVAACLALVVARGVVAHASEKELRDQQEKQRQVQADTDHVVRRLTTMLRVMRFYHLESPEQEIMKEMSGALAGLSKNQMAEVIRQLENAAQAKDEKLSDEARDKAYEQHRQVLVSLHEMLARFDAIKSLDQAADRFEKHAKNQLELHLQSTQSIRDLGEYNKSDLSPTVKLLISTRMRNHGTEMKRQSDNQNDLERDVDILVKQVKKLDKLSPDQDIRVKAMSKRIADVRLPDNLRSAAKRLRTLGYPENRLKAFKFANELQWENAAHLQELARVLRLSGDALAVLREAREKIEQAIAKQDDIQNELKQREVKNSEDQAKSEKDPNQANENIKLPGPQDSPKVEPDKANPMAPKVQVAKAIQDAVNAEKNAEAAKKQAQLAFDTKDIANLLKPTALDAAKKLETANLAMEKAKEKLLKNESRKAIEAQAQASEKLKATRAELDKMIAAADKAKNDPLAAVQKALENIDQIIKDQVKTKDDTKEAFEPAQKRKLPELANKQKELANKTDAVKNQPLPNKEKIETALEKATREMRAAAKSLDANESPEAVTNQENALDALKDVRKELAEKAGEIEKRRDDIAKLEDAGKKLTELAKQEREIAQKAEMNANQPQADAVANKELAKNQEDITPKATELAKELNKTAPKAADKINDGAKNMQAAKKDLEKNEPKSAAQEAQDATKKLEVARNVLQDALSDLKGKEIADQVAMKKDTDPAAAAQQVAKALEETKKAADAAQEAQGLKNDPMPNSQAQEKTEPVKRQEKTASPSNQQRDSFYPKPDLTKQQAEIAKAAEQLQLLEAAKEAQKAADAIKQGDIAKALENQMSTLKQLQDEAQQPGEPAQLAQQQQAVMDATKALAQSQQANQAAQAALAQAQAQAPQTVQPQLQQAAQQLQDAAQQLQKAAPAQAGQAQEQAAQNLGQALQTLNHALAQMGQPQAKPGEPGTSPGQKQQTAQAEPAEPKGDGKGQAKDQGKGQGKGKEFGKSNEQNQAKGDGNRQADGSVNNRKSQLNNVSGDGAFIHLPQRQRELIRQAISGNLPPEYANLIQQYYINIARGRPATGSGSSSPPAPTPR